MTTIYLAEDEIYAMMALKQKILDLGEDYVIVGAADNGVTALEEITALCPDIVLTDIRMPDMDGLTLLEKLRESGSQSLTVIISGFQDFQYAQQAVKLGASDYLLKPVNPPELQSCLEKCSDELRKKQKNIVSFLIGDETFSFENTPEQNAFTILYIVIANPLSSVENTLHPKVTYLPNSEVEQLFHSVHSCKFWRCFDGYFSNEKVLLLSKDKKSDGLLSKNITYFLKALEEKTGSYITIYHSASPSDLLLSAIPDCRSSAIRQVILGESLICSGNPAPPADTSKLEENTEFYSLMVSQGQWELLHTNLTHQFRLWKEEKRPCMSIISDLLFIMDTLRRKTPSRRKLEFSNLYFLENIASFSDTNEEFAENFYQLLLALFTNPETEATSADDLTESLIRYFNTHLSSNLTLQDLEEKTGFSKVYICRMFKKVQNTTPIDYFNRLKIARAQKMLTEFPNLSLREIADSLGFSDVYYFSKVFKKITGAPPSEMRR